MENEEIKSIKDIERDLRFIESEIIAKQYEKDKITGEEKYVKYSRALKCVVAINLTKKQYINYWGAQYKSHPEQLKLILEKIEDKFENGLISAENMLELIRASKDFESEKKNAIKVLTKPKEKKIGEDS